MTDLPFPLVNSVPEFLSQDKQLLVTWELNTSYCIRIEISKNSGKSWEIVDPCALPSQKPIIITEDGVNKVNISICLRSRYQVCGVPVAAKISKYLFYSFIILPKNLTSLLGLVSPKLSSHTLYIQRHSQKGGKSCFHYIGENFYLKDKYL